MKKTEKRKKETGGNVKEMREGCTHFNLMSDEVLVSKIHLLGPLQE